jgi:tetrapyrrole methylase family protein/MazG family protein/ATP diphosphatase
MELKPAMDPADLDPRSIATLKLIMRALRTPGSGCPWDLAQTFDTIAPYTIEEAYEVADAIARGSRAQLRDELGDLLLQVVYHARMAEEEGAFDFDDVVEAISAKMIRRHPHVFGDATSRASPPAKGFWEAAKAEERSRTASDSLLEDVPMALPALLRAVKLQARAARAGFDWPGAADVVKKIAEEARELAAAADTAAADKDEVREELGDLLFALVNLARHFEVDPETALRSANAKFERRFRFIERQLARHGKRPETSTLEEMDALWNEAKMAER